MTNQIDLDPEIVQAEIKDLRQQIAYYRSRAIRLAVQLGWAEMALGRQDISTEGLDSAAVPISRITLSKILVDYRRDEFTAAASKARFDKQLEADLEAAPTAGYQINVFARWLEGMAAPESGKEE